MRIFFKGLVINKVDLMRISLPLLIRVAHSHLPLCAICQRQTDAQDWKFPEHKSWPKIPSYSLPTVLSLSGAFEDLPHGVSHRSFGPKRTGLCLFLGGLAEISENRTFNIWFIYEPFWVKAHEKHVALLSKAFATLQHWVCSRVYQVPFRHQ